ncbi:MAG: LPS export ABC transporter permease LptG [Burkholderiaceae bacterium]|jgi:lipopolysaccharide export system permease protein
MTPRLITNYLRREVYTAVTFVLLVFLGLFAFFDLIGEVDQFAKPSVSINGIILSVLLTMPARVYELAPLATLIGTIYALARIAANSEYMVMRASGLSTRMALTIVLRIGVGIVLLTLIFGEIVTPATERLALQARARALGAGGDGHFRSGQWLRDSVEVDGRVQVRFVNFLSLDANGDISDLKVYELDAAGLLRQTIVAESAVYLSDGNWLLRKVVSQQFPVNLLLPDAMPVLNSQPTATWLSSLTPELLAGLYLRPERMSVLQLWRYKAFLEQNFQRTDSIVLALAKKLVYPLAIMVMLLIALPFAYLQARAGGLSVKIFTGIMLGIGFHLANNLFSHLSMIAQLPPLLSAAIPTLFGLTGAIVALWWLERVK